MRERYCHLQFRGPKGYVRIYYNHDWNEFICKFWQGGIRRPQGDYHTDSESDAIGTAKQMVSQERQL